MHNKDNIFSPKEIVIEDCRAQIACMLNELWHSRLPKIHWSNVVRNTHYICFAFFWKEAVIGVGIWSSPVAQNRFKNGKELLELRRLALSDVCPYNTATYVLSQMIKAIKIKFPEIKKLISYQDTKVHSGTIYKAANFKEVGRTSPMKHVYWKGKRYHPRSLTIDRPYSYKLRDAVKTGDATVTIEKPKIIFIITAKGRI